MRTRTSTHLPLLLATGALALGLVGCGGSAGSSASASSTSAAATSAATEATSAVDSTSAASAVEVAGGALTADALANVDVTVALDDFDAMQDLANKIQNFEADGLVVKVDGYVSNFGKGMSYNIVEFNADKSKNIGTTFVIEGAEESAYPSDGTHVILTGKVMRNDTGSFYIICTLPEFVEVQG